MESWGTVEIIEMIFSILVSFGFFAGIVLMVSPEAFDALNKALSKEYGIKTRIVPKLELKAIHILDRFVMKNRIHGIVVGFLISAASFFLLLAYRR